MAQYIMIHVLFLSCSSVTKVTKLRYKKNIVFKSFECCYIRVEHEIA